MSGDGIINGLGPNQMIAALDELGKLTIKLFYQLKGGTKPWAEVGKAVKKQITEEFKKR